MIRAEVVVACKTSSQHVYNQVLEVKPGLVKRLNPPTICDVCGDSVGFLEIFIIEVP